jgi:hypothetical protein
MVRDWTDSLRFDGISAEAERLFLRLIMKADDYGRFHADPRLVKAGCFPLIESLKPEKVAEWIAELENRGLIVCYEVDLRKFLSIVNYGQRLKNSRFKFPAMTGKTADWLPTSRNFPELPGTSRNFPPEVEVEVEEKENTKEKEKKKTNSAKADRSLPLPFASDAFAKAWMEWRKHRTEIRKPLTASSAEKQLAKLAAMGEAAAIATIDHSIAGGWQGLFPPAHTAVAGNKNRFAGIQEDIPL